MDHVSSGSTHNQSRASSARKSLPAPHKFRGHFDLIEMEPFVKTDQFGINKTSQHFKSMAQPLGDFGGIRNAIHQSLNPSSS